MIKIIPDHEGWLTQWDKNRTVLVSGLDLTEYPDAVVQFSSPNDGVDKAYPVKPYVGDDGLVHAKFPNIFLTFPGRVDVCVYRDDHTCSFGVLVVAPHEKPDDYVYTETEVLDWRTLDKKIDDVRAMIPEKLSQLDNDLYYDKADAEPFCTIRKEDLIFDEDARLYYGSVDSVPDPIPDHFKLTITFAIPDGTSGLFEADMVEMGSIPEKGLYYFEVKNGMPVAVEINGFFWSDDSTADGKTYIEIPSVGYDSIVSASIYCAHTKKIPGSLLDLSEIEEQINGISDLVDSINEEVV